MRKVLQGLKSTNQREKLEPVPEADLTETFGGYKVTSTYLKAFKGHLYSSIRACQYEMSQRKVQGEESNGSASRAPLRSLATRAPQAQAERLRDSARDRIAADVRRKLQAILVEDAHWSEIQFAVSEWQLRIEIRGKTAEFALDAAGFGKHDQRLDLLRLMAARHGNLDIATLPLNKEKTPLKTLVSRLRRLLQDLIRIDGNPIVHKKIASM